jgi:hypothetical protein
MMRASWTGHKASVCVQEQACGALKCLAVNADNKVRIVLAGGIEEVMAAMKEHRAIAGVQEQACGALINLAANSNTANKVWIAGAGGIEAVVAAMAANKASAGVQEQACGALRSLAGAQFTCFTGTKVQILTLRNLAANNNTVNKVKIAEAGGINAIVDVMVALKAHAGVQELACGALRSLAGAQFTSFTGKKVQILT